MQQMNVNELKPHPQNDFFFDNITGENWDAFLESIKTSGVIEPVIATQEKVTVSGHQRIRACEELGITTIPCDIRIYETDDQLLKDLLETNLRQRGLGNTNPIKLGRCIKELERIYGIRVGGNGGNQFNKGEFPNNSEKAITQPELASQIGISVDTLNNYKKLTTLIPELGDLVETGIVTPTTASTMLAKLSPEEQLELVNSMDVTKKIKQREVESYINTIRQLKSQPPKTIEKIVDNTDTTLLLKNKKLIEDLERLKRDNESLNSTNRILESSKKTTENISESYKKLSEEYKKQSEEYINIKSKIIDMGLEPDGEYNLYSAASEIAKLTKEIESLLVDKLAPTRYKNFMIAVKNSDVLRKNFKNTLDMVNDWYVTMVDYIDGSNNECNYETNNHNNVIDMEEK